MRASTLLTRSRPLNSVTHPCANFTVLLEVVTLVPVVAVAVLGVHGFLLGIPLPRVSVDGASGIHSPLAVR